MNKPFICPICKRNLEYANEVIVVNKGEKPKRGRMAWRRDGICLKCARREAERAKGGNEGDSRGI